MNKNIFITGSCRVQSSFKIYKKENELNHELFVFRPLVHSIEEHIQNFEHLKYDKVFAKDTIDLRWGEPTYAKLTENDKYIFGQNLEKADIFVIEICGSKFYCDNDSILNPFPSTYKNHDFFECHLSDNICAQLNILTILADYKPIVIVTNHNVYNKETRKNLILDLEKYSSQYNNIKVWNPTEKIKELGIKKCLLNENHYTPEFKKIHVENILELIEELI